LTVETNERFDERAVVGDIDPITKPHSTHA